MINAMSPYKNHRRRFAFVLSKTRRSNRLMEILLVARLNTNIGLASQFHLSVSILCSWESVLMCRPKPARTCMTLNTVPMTAKICGYISEVGKSGRGILLTVDSMIMPSSHPTARLIQTRTYTRRRTVSAASNVKISDTVKNPGPLSCTAII